MTAVRKPSSETDLAYTVTVAKRKAANLPTKPSEIDEHYTPENDWELEHLCLKSWQWRIFSGQLYKVMTKDDEFQEGSVVPFKPNWAQREFITELHYRNIILKARQLGFTTLIAILWLDHALFVENQRVGIIAHKLDDAEVIFRDKVKFVYDNLPLFVRELMPVRSETTKQIVFAHNNSAIRVATSMRSGTINRLHISEFGKIAAQMPGKAREIKTGSLPTVPQTGIVVIESTAEGSEGEFFDLADIAEKRSYIPQPLGPRDYAFHFFAWWQNPEYVYDPKNVKFTDADHLYFHEVEQEMHCKLSMEQRAWYVAQRDIEQSGDQEKMWREYPSTPAECWKRSAEGTYFGRQMAVARASKRIGVVPHIEGVRVHTFWDIGASDGTAIWFLQHLQDEYRWINFMEGWGEGYSHFVTRMEKQPYLWGRHYLPHDGNHVRQLGERVASPLMMLQEIAPAWSFDIVPRVEDLQHGIAVTRTMLGQSRFDAENCAAGIKHIELYHKKFNTSLGRFIDTPEKNDGHSEAADAIRQCAQGFDPLAASGVGSIDRSKDPKGGMPI